MRPRRAIALILASALLAAACGGGDSADDTTTTRSAATETTAAPTTTTAPATTTTAGGGETTTTSGGGATELTIGAEDSEGFTLDSLRAPAGEVTVTFENDDAGGEPHNWHVLTDDGEWATPIKDGPDTSAVTFVVSTPGEFEYWCDTHSEAMRGTLIVVAP